MAKQVEWMGETKCDVCHHECGKELYDAKTKFGGWATLCQSCYIAMGVGIGTGLGQKYEKQPDGKYVKVKG